MGSRVQAAPLKKGSSWSPTIAPQVFSPFQPIDARGRFRFGERQNYLLKVRAMTRDCARVYVKSKGGVPELTGDYLLEIGSDEIRPDIFPVRWRT